MDGGAGPADRSDQAHELHTLPAPGYTAAIAAAAIIIGRQ
jgi:hypothetical protein